MSRARVDIDAGAFETGLRAAIVGYKASSRLAIDELGTEVANDYASHVGVDTGQLRASISSIPVPHPDGPAVSVGSRGVRHARVHEFGSSPHVIRSKGPWPLRNRRTGQVFGRVVNHPGTAPNPAFRTALLRASLTWRPNIHP